MNKKTTRFPLFLSSLFKNNNTRITIACILLIAVNTAKAQNGCKGKLGSPIVTIDFNKGKGQVDQNQVTPIKPNISSAYKFAGNPNGMTDGFYCISNRSDLWYTDWHVGYDHTPGDSLGRMLVVNAALAKGEFCRIRVDSLCLNTKFEFSSYIANVQRPWPYNGCGAGGEIPINVKFQIEDLSGKIIDSSSTGNIRVDSFALVWNRKAFLFNTGNNTSVQLILKNNGNGGCGNDLAIDDISFAACGPNLSIKKAEGCSGMDFAITVDSATNVYPNPVYLWEYSTDKGVTWNTAPNGDKSSVIINHNNSGKDPLSVLYRVYAAGDIASIRNPKCRVVSPVQEILIHPSPKPDFTKSTPFCIGGPVYFEASSNSPGTDKYQWTFQNGIPSTATTPKVTVRWPDAGKYSVSLVVTDAHGCKNDPFNATQDVLINGRPKLVIAPAKTALYCNAKFVTLSATDSTGYKHQWKKDNNNITGANNATYNANAAGWYYDYIIDANGCNNKDSVLVAPADVFKGKIVGTSNISCFGKKDGEAEVAVTNKDPNNYTYKWSPVGGTGTKAANLEAGDYKVYITDKATGCMDTVFIKLTAPASDISIVPLQVVAVKCYGDATGAAKVKVSGGTKPYTYEWTTAAGPIFHNYDTISNLTAQQYTVLVTDSNGCGFNRVIDIKEPKSPLSATDSVKNLSCYENNNAFISVKISGGTPGYIYSWNTPTAHKDTIQNAKPGKYTVTVKDLNGCTISRTVEVKGPTTPLSDSLRYLKPVICYEDKNGIAFVLPKGGTPGYKYLWSTGATTDSVKDLNAGKYAVKITDKNGCTIVDSLEVKGPKEILSVSITNTTLSCFKDSSAQATASAKGGTPGYAYEWQTQPKQTSSTIQNLKAGVYTIIVKDANSCTVSKSVTITEPQFPPDEYTINANYCDEDSVIVLHAEKGYAPYQWFEDGKPIKGATADSLVTSNYKNRKITVTWFKSGCRHQSSELKVTEPNRFFFPENDNTTTIFTPNGDGQGDLFYPYSSVYTNQIDYYAKEYRLQIFDRWGKLIFETTDYNTAWDGNYNSSAASSGVYYWLSSYVSRCGGGSKKINNKGFVHLMK